MSTPVGYAFGVGNDFPKGRQVDYVLNGFWKKKNCSELPALIDRSIEMIKSFVSDGAGPTMTKFNNK